MKCSFCGEEKKNLKPSVTLDGKIGLVCFGCFKKMIKSLTIVEKEVNK